MYLLFIDKGRAEEVMARNMGDIEVILDTDEVKATPCTSGGTEYTVLSKSNAPTGFKGLDLTVMFGLDVPYVVGGKMDAQGKVRSLTAHEFDVLEKAYKESKGSTR